MELKPITQTEFLGYDETIVNSEIIKFRKVNQKGKSFYQIVLNKTPFYAESGGQVGDTGWLDWKGNKIEVTDTKKENNLIIHIVENIPDGFSGNCIAAVDLERRKLIEENHSATHLLHFALRKVLGTHVEQKGSLVSDERLRFDFLHVQKMSQEEIEKVENIVNSLIRKGIVLHEQRGMSIFDAKKMGAMALFSEKYEDQVRVIGFGESVELCGGTHVNNTSRIGLVKIVSESAIAAGIRRIEAISGVHALEFYKDQEKQLNSIKELFKNPKDIIKAVENIFLENDKLTKQVAEIAKEKSGNIKDEIIKTISNNNGVNVAFCKIDIPDAGMLRDIAFQVKAQVENLFLVLGTEINGKAHVAVMVSENLVKEKNLHAGNIVKEIAKEINGGGGGQPFYATAGGTKPEGINNALKKAESFIL